MHFEPLFFDRQSRMPPSAKSFADGGIRLVNPKKERQSAKRSFRGLPRYILCFLLKLCIVKGRIKTVPFQKLRVRAALHDVA